MNNKKLIKKFQEPSGSLERKETITFGDYGDFNKYLSNETGGYSDLDSKDFSEQKSKPLIPLTQYNPRDLHTERPKDVNSGFNHLINWYSNPRRQAILEYNKLEGQQHMNEALSNIQKYSRQAEPLTYEDESGIHEIKTEDVVASMRTIINNKILPTQSDKLGNIKQITKDLKSKLQNLHSMHIGVGNGRQSRDGSLYSDWGIHFNKPEELARPTKQALSNLAENVFTPKIQEDGSSQLTTGYYFKGSHGIPEHIAFKTDKDVKELASHEGTHALNLREVENVAGRIVGDTNTYDSEFTSDPYLDSGSEVLARLATVREKNNIDPNHVYTLEEIKQLQKNNKGDDEILSRYPAEILLQLFNRVAKNDSFDVPEHMKYINPDEGINYAKRGIKLKTVKPTRGGFSDDTYEKRKRDLYRWTPAAGLYDPFQLVFNNANTGEENEYYKTYLGFESAVPLMTPGAETEWDAQIEAEKKDNGELPSEFYGTTKRMDHHLQAAADTLNLGKMVRGEMPLIDGLSQNVAERAYKQAKRVMDNPGEWQQMEDHVIQTNPEFDETYENNPLGMLDQYGMKWDPEQGKLFIHDTYDFPEWTHKIGFMQKRPREMKIRGAIKFDPKKGSLLLRDQNYQWPQLKVLK